MFKKISILIVLSFLFFSCANKEQNPNIQDIVNLWTDIEKNFSSQEDFTDKNLIEGINSFYLVLKIFEKSDLFRTYSLIPYPKMTERSLMLRLPFEERTGIDCRAEIDEICFEFLSLEKRLQIFRIVQEALSNIEKHSQAKVAIVTMREGLNGIVFIGISDDGIGFNSPLDNNGDIQTIIDRSHIGIVSMKERAAILGGSFKINTEEGEGSLVCLEIPIGRGENNGSIIS